MLKDVRPEAFYYAYESTHSNATRALFLSLNLANLMNTEMPSPEASYAWDFSKLTTQNPPLTSSACCVFASGAHLTNLLNE